MEFFFTMVFTVIGMWLMGYVFFAAAVAWAAVLATPVVIAEKLLKNGTTPEPLVKESPTGDNKV